MIRTWLALAVLCAGTARGAGPSYSAAGIVNASNYAPGPFAANSVITVFGSGLARSTHALTADDLVACTNSLTGKCLPTELNYVRVYVQERPMPILFVGDKQVNFLMSSLEPAGIVKIRVVTEGITGPEITLTLVDSAPALFALPDGTAIATDREGQLLTASHPAHAGDIVVVYATGLGVTSPNPAVGEIPNYAASILPTAALKITLNGAPVDADRIKYAGLTPLSAGLYQINLELPCCTGDDPEIRVTAGTLTAPGGLKLPLR
ncbi:MAG: hypothetical protein ABI806_16560 [Candidatus Solibacter sp.]